jgi:hypothetical protein
VLVPVREARCLAASLDGIDKMLACRLPRSPKSSRLARISKSDNPATAHAHRHSPNAFCVDDRRLPDAESQDLPTVSPRNGASDC